MSNEIPPIQSAVLNIGTAISDCELACEAWAANAWSEATLWINNAIAQLESAKAKIAKHQERQPSPFK